MLPPSFDGRYTRPLCASAGSNCTYSAFARTQPNCLSCAATSTASTHTDSTIDKGFFIQVQLLKWRSFTHGKAIRKAEITRVTSFVREILLWRCRRGFADTISSYDD